MRHMAKMFTAGLGMLTGVGALAIAGANASTTRPELSVSVDRTSVLAGDTVKLTYTLTNPSLATNTVVDFTHTLPAAVYNVHQEVATTTCSAAVFPGAHSARIVIDHLPSTSCKVTLLAKVGGPGSYDFGTGVASSTLGNFTTVTADDVVIAHDPAAPIVTMSASETELLLGDTTTLTYTITGPAFGAAHDAISLAHVLPPGTAAVTGNTCTAPEPPPDTTVPTDATTVPPEATTMPTPPPTPPTPPTLPPEATTEPSPMPTPPPPPEATTVPAPPDTTPPPVTTPTPPTAATTTTTMPWTTTTPTTPPDGGPAPVAANADLTDLYLAASDTQDPSTCEIVVEFETGAAGAFALHQNLTLDGADDGVAETQLFVADPTSPTVSLTFAEPVVTLGDDVEMTWTVTGVAFGTQHHDVTFADFNLSNIVQPYFDQGSVVSNDCGGLAQPYGVTGGTLAATRTGQVQHCQLVTTWHTLGAGTFSFGGHDAVLGLRDGVQATLDVQPTVTVTEVERATTCSVCFAATDYVVGDAGLGTARLSYVVEGGNAYGTKDWTVGHGFDGFVDAAIVADSDACGVASVDDDGAIAASGTVSDLVDVATERTSCTFLVDVNAGRPGQHDLATGITTDGASDRTASISVVADDATEPTVSLDLDLDHIAIGGEAILTYSVTGVPYGTSHDLWLAEFDQKIARAMFDVRLVASDCGGTLFTPGDGGPGWALGVDGAVLDAVRALPASCTIVLGLTGNAAETIDLGNSFDSYDNGTDRSLGYDYVSLPLTVDPTVSVSADASAYDAGDTVTLDYLVDGGSWLPSAFPGGVGDVAARRASGPGAWSFESRFPSSFSDVAITDDTCDAGSLGASNTFSAAGSSVGWEDSATQRCDLTVTLTASEPGRFDLASGLTPTNVTAGEIDTFVAHDTAAPVVTMALSSTTATVGDAVTATFTVTGPAYGAAHGQLSFWASVPDGLGTGTLASNSCGGSPTSTADAVAINAAAIAASDTATRPSCSLSVVFHPTTTGAFAVASTTVTNGVGDRIAPATLTVAKRADQAGFVAVVPVRALDSRSNYVRIDAGSITTIDLAGRYGVPANATDVVLNVTVTNPAGPGFVTLYPCGTERPTTSNVNFGTGETRSNNVSVHLGGSGVCVYNSVGLHLVVDVNGAQVPAGGAGFVAVAPNRVLDTRGGEKVGSTGRVLHLAGVGGVPADASAAVLNVTATGADADGFLTVYPCGETMPLASSVNFSAGLDVANSVYAKLGTNGDVCMYASVATDVVVDVNGAYGPSGSQRYLPVAQSRLVDTRSGNKPAAGSITEVAIAGLHGFPANTTAAVLNVTAVDAAGTGFVTVYPCGTTRPLASNLNYAAGRTVPNAVTVPLGEGGKVCVFTQRSVNLVIDAFAAYVPR